VAAAAHAGSHPGAVPDGPLIGALRRGELPLPASVACEMLACRRAPCDAGASGGSSSGPRTHDAGSYRIAHTRTFPRRPRDDARIAGGEAHASSHSRVIYTPAELR
jgi:hypothetical protein